jgi:anti-sigma B factor antagonist
MGTESSRACRIDTRKTEHALIVDIAGPLYLGEGSTALAEKVKALLGEGHRNIALNFAGVPKIDSSGMGALVHAHTSVRNAGGKLRLFAITPQVQMILKMVRLETVFEIHPDEATALASFT